MKKNLLSILTLSSALTLTVFAQSPAPQPQDSPQASGSHGNHGGRGGRGMGMNGRGIMGTVTAVTADHYTIKDQAGTTYTINYSANSRIVKQPDEQHSAQGTQGAQSYGAPTPIKSTEIKVGDMITAMGEVDDTTKSIGAIVIVQLDPERVRQMQQMQANYGKTWLMGRVTAVEGTSVTLEGSIDHTPHTFVANEGTTFRSRGGPITLADITNGNMVRVEGSLKSGVFTASAVNVMNGGDRPHGSPVVPPDAPKN